MANPNPSPETRFNPGQSGNPGGKTSAHRKAEVEAAELAAKARLGLVRAFANLVEGTATDQDRMSLLNSDALRLLKDSEDRGYGAPTQPVDNTSSDGSMKPTAIRIVGVAPEARDAQDAS
jgi:hypothetical protein